MESFKRTVKKNASYKNANKDMSMEIRTFVELSCISRLIEEQTNWITSQQSATHETLRIMSTLIKNNNDSLDRINAILEENNKSLTRLLEKMNGAGQT